MNDPNDSGTSDTKGDSPAITRRDALAKLAMYSAYTAPTVMTLLASKPSMAALVSANTACMVGDDASGISDPGDTPSTPTGTAYDLMLSGDHMADNGMANRAATGMQSAGTGVNWDTSMNMDVTVATNDTTIDCGR